MKNKMSLKPSPSTKLNLKKLLIYGIIGTSALSILVYVGLSFFGVIGTPKTAFATQVTGYDWEAVITIDNTMVSGTNNLTDFPIVITLNYPDLKTTSNGGGVTDNNGYDIVFADMNNDQLDHQIESYDPLTGELVAWIRIPTLYANVDTEFKMFFGNSSLAVSGSGIANPSTENVWSNNYEAVWHMNNDPSNSDLDDGAGTYDALSNGNMNSSDLIEGKIGPAIDFDGNNDRYAIKDKIYSGSGAIPTLTVMGWFKTTFNHNTWTKNWAMLDFDRSEYFNVFVNGNGKMGFSTTGSGSGSGINDFFVGSAGQYNDGNWHHVAAVYDGTNKYIYMDGVLAGTKTNAHNGQPLGKGTVQRYGFIGDGSEASTFNGNRNNINYQGQYDEINLLETNLSADWIATSYANQNSPNIFSNLSFTTSPLPVELTNFKVELIGEDVEIVWTTATEINNDYFTIEKSTDAINFEEVDEVPGAGNSQTTLNYDYLDNNVLDGVSYYRLKQTDFNGEFKYYAALPVDNGSEGETLKINNVKPNPFTNKFTIEIESGKSGLANFILMDISGNQIDASQINIDEGTTEFTYANGSKLVSGTYIINIIHDGVPTTIKVIKK